MEYKGHCMEKIEKFLFYLGKGIWKSVPILGNIIDEVVYENFLKEKLESNLKNLTADELIKIQSIIPCMDMEKTKIMVETITNKIQGIIEDMLPTYNSNINAMHTQLESLERKTDTILNSKLILDEIKEKIGNENSLRVALKEIEDRRMNWVQRISKNQKNMLSNISIEFEPVEKIWGKNRKFMPECGYKEFRFRLHELEWLGLVSRYFDIEENMWFYKRVEETNKTI